MFPVFKKTSIIPGILFLIGTFAVLNGKIQMNTGFTFREILYIFFGLLLILNESKLNRYRLYPFVIVFFLTALFYDAYKENFSATWYIIDDHKVAEFQLYLRSGSHGFLEILCMGTYNGMDALCSPFSAARYHPTAQIVHFLKQVFFAENPLLWFIEKFTVIYISLILVFYIISRFTGYAFAFFFTVTVFSEKYFSHFFIMHMPSETYGLLSYAVCGYAIYRLMQENISEREYKIQWILLGTFSLLGIGMKENLIVFIFPVLLMLVLEFPKRKINFLNITFSVLSVLLTLLVVYSVVLTLSRSGQDIYARDTKATSRLPMLLTAISITKLHLYALFIILLFSASIRYIGRPIQNYSRNLLLFVLIQGYNLLNFYFQFVFYNAEIPQHTRYDFPGMTVFPFFWVINLIYFLSVLKETEMRQKYSSLLKAGAAAGLLILAVKNPFLYLKEASHKSRVRTNTFTDKIQIILNKTKEHPDWPVSFETFSPLDYEPLFSTEAFLHLYGIQNSISMRPKYKRGEGSSSLETALNTQIQNCSEKGCGAGIGFKPKISESEKNCYSVYFGADKGESNCEVITRIW